MHRNPETTSGAAGTQREDQATAGDARADAPAPAAPLDFEALDLSIETVEERISPSETNVFDK